MSLTVTVEEIINNSHSPLLSKHLSWMRVYLREIAEVQNGFAFSSEKFQKEKGIPLIRIRDILNNSTDCKYDGNYDQFYIVNSGDLLIGMDGDFNCALWKGSIGLLNQRVCRINIKPDSFDLKFLAHLLPGYLKAINNATSSITVKHLSSKSIEDISLPLPPLAEQHRIVEAIEQQFSRLDAGIASLKQAQKKLKRYRASILKAAVEGELTAEWRVSHPAVEPASQLLARILQERRAKWEEEQRAKGKGPEEMRYIEPTISYTSDLQELPEKWRWTSLGQCFEVHVGATPSRKDANYWGGEISWVSSGEVKFSQIMQTKEHITQAGLENSSTQINPVGSVLMGMIGEGKTRGQVAVLGIPACNNQNSAAIWVSQTPIKPLLIYYWLWSQYDIIRTGSSGNNQPALNKARVQQMKFPLPPLAEQEQIVSLVEEQLSIIGQLESDIHRGLKRAERMRQSILHRAFTGRLVAQDPDDEPASVLLERIRQGREEKRPMKPGTHKAQGQARAEKAARTPSGPRVPQEQAGPIDVEHIVQPDLWQSVEAEI